MDIIVDFRYFEKTELIEHKISSSEVTMPPPRPAPLATGCCFPGRPAGRTAHASARRRRGACTCDAQVRAWAREQARGARLRC